MIARGILHSGTELKLPSRPPGHRPEVLAPFDSAHPIYKAIDEQSQRLAFERQRVELALIISETLNDDLIFETQRAWGAEETRATYKQEFGKFQEWCRDQKLPSLPTSPEVVALFLIARSTDTRPERLARMVSAIRFIHEWSDKAFRSDDVQIKAALRFAKRCWEQEEASAQSPAVESTEPSSLNGSGGAH